MYNTIRNRTLLINLVFGLFIATFTANSIGYIFWQTDSIAIELEDVKDSESESEKKENKTEKDSEDKIPFLTDELSNLTIKQICKEMLLLNHYSFPNLDNPTPPPEHYLS